MNCLAQCLAHSKVLLTINYLRMSFVMDEFHRYKMKGWGRTRVFQAGGMAETKAYRSGIIKKPPVPRLRHYGSAMKDPWRVPQI